MNDGFVSALMKLPETSWISLGTFELLLVTFVFSFVVWYLQFHWNRRRLYQYAAKLPGPYPYPIIGSAMSFMGNPYEIFSTIMKMFTEYPEIFRVWFVHRCAYVTSNPKHYEIILPDCLEKERWYDKAKGIVGEGLVTARYDKWRKHRKLISPTFNQKILDSFVEIFNEQSVILVQQLEKQVGEGEIDIFHIVSKCTLDIICETAMGVKVHAQTTDTSFTMWVGKALEIIFLKAFVWWYHISPLFNMTEKAREMKECERNILKFTAEVVKEKMEAYRKMEENPSVEEERKRKIFLDYLLEISHKQNVNFSQEELRDEVDTFIIAGSDTTATTSCFILTMLGMHQEFQERVFDEIMEIIGPHRSIEPEDLPKLKYLERFIKETLRLFPAIGFIFRQIEQDIDVGDCVIPAGVSVLFGLIRTHTNEKYWPDPYRFDPDRFLPEEVAKRHHCAYIPFSYGPRNCIGLRFAMMALKSLVVTVVRKYRIFTSYEKVEDIKLKCHFIMKPKDGYKIFIERR